MDIVRYITPLLGSWQGLTVLRLNGSYAAPTGPDWLADPSPAGGGAGGRITMHNVVPGEDPYQVVELVLGR